MYYPMVALVSFIYDEHNVVAFTVVAISTSAHQKSSIHHTSGHIHMKTKLS